MGLLSVLLVEGVMKRLTQLGLMLAVFVASVGPARAEDKDAAFDSFLKTYTTTWNEHDGDALAALFTADADLIMGSLPSITGRQAIGGWWKMYFSKIDVARKGDFEVRSLRDLAPGVLLVNVDSKTWGTGPHGEKLQTRLARGTWVLTNSKGDWLIAAMRGLPAEGESRTRPGTDR